MTDPVPEGFGLPAVARPGPRGDAPRGRPVVRGHAIGWP